MCSSRDQHLVRGRIESDIASTPQLPAASTWIKSKLRGGNHVHETKETRPMICLRG